LRIASLEAQGRNRDKVKGSRYNEEKQGQGARYKKKTGARGSR